MTGLRNLEENIARLEKANEETREVIREAHETIRTINLTLKELKKEHHRWSNGVRDEVDERITRQVDLGLIQFKKDIQTATSNAHQHVLDEFDKLTNIMLYGNARGKGETLVSEWIREAIRQEVKLLGRRTKVENG